MSFRLAAAPKFAALRSWDCSRCGRAEVKPVFVDDGSGAIAVGSGCASVLLGRPRSSARRIVDDFAAIERREVEIEAMRAERRDTYTRALAALDVTGDNADLLRARQTFHGSGGFDALGSFPAWVARVAVTGELAA